MKINYGNRENLKLIFFIILLIIAIAYGMFRAYPLIAGANITVYSPKDGEIVASTTFQIKGQVVRADEIRIQNKPVTIDTQGNFNETLIAEYPYTIIVLEATDKYGDKVTKTLRVIPSP